MVRGLRKVSALLLLVMLVAMIASVSASAAEEKRFDLPNGSYVTVSNIIEVKKIEDRGYGETLYVGQAPVTVTFHGEMSKEANIVKWPDRESLDYVEIKDQTAVLTEVMELGYGIFPLPLKDSREQNAVILLQVVADASAAGQSETAEEAQAAPAEAAASPAAPATNSVSAAPTDAKVLVNGKSVSFEAYNLNGNNYFKLRDLALALNGSEKSFAVGWDEAKNAISLTSGKPYASEGGDQASSKGSSAKQAVETTAKIYVDGKEVSATAYNIDGNNYFKLRDVAKALNFGVTWDSSANSIGIATKATYQE